MGASDTTNMPALDVPFHYSNPALIIVASCTGALSFFSSLAIATVILRSRSNTVFHRILFLISLFDMISSSAIALVTVPMPSDVIYPYAFPSYGTTATCTIQGFLFSTGVAAQLLLGVHLNFYYLCRLRYKIEDAEFTRRFERIIHPVSIAIVLIPQIYLLVHGGFNAGRIDPFCGAVNYPRKCHEILDYEGVCRGPENKLYELLRLAVIFLAFVTLVATMALIVHSFFRDEKRLEQEDPNMTDEQIIARVELTQESKRIVSKQALMYMAAFFLTWLFFFPDVASESPWITLMRMVFQPLQGFFNMIIFFHQKILTMRKARDLEDTSSFKIFIIILFGPPLKTTDEIQVQNIEFVMFHQNIPSLNYVHANEASLEEGLSSHPSQEFETIKCLDQNISKNHTSPMRALDHDTPDPSKNEEDLEKDNDKIYYGQARRSSTPHVPSYDHMSYSSRSLSGFDAMKRAGYKISNFDSDTSDPSKNEDLEIDNDEIYYDQVRRSSARKAPPKGDISFSSRSLGGFDDIESTRSPLSARNSDTFNPSTNEELQIDSD